MTSDTNPTSLHDPDDTRVGVIIYSGAYDHEGSTYLWHCASSVTVYEVRPRYHITDTFYDRTDGKLWVELTKGIFALVDKAYFSNPRVQKMTTNGN